MAISVWEYGADPALDVTAGTRIQLIAGNTLTTTETFLDEDDQALEAFAGYPRVRILEGKAVVADGFGYQKIPTSGQWFCDLTIPEMLEFQPGESEKTLTMVWEFRSTDNQTLKNSLHISVMPRSVLEEEQTNEQVQLVPFNGLTIRVPYIVNMGAGDKAQLTIYQGNNPQGAYHLSTVEQRGSSSILHYGVALDRALLVPYNMIVNLSIGGTQRQVYQQLYTVNPSILGAMQSLDLAINKANQLEAIPGLRFREVDLLQGLIRGLDHFNSIGPTLTSFTGADMRGSILEGWLVCACIKVLRAQLQAEGWFNFDFSGQNVSLNVDRTAAIESHLGHLEGLVDSMLRPLKTLLGKKGVIGGDGATGDKLAYASSMGVTTLSNNAVTRSRVGGGYNRRW